MCARAKGAGVALIPGQDFFPSGSALGAHAARLAFSYEPVERIREGVERLAGLFV
jgi:DNA-binding transcriptional MocR family regulator